MFFGSKSNVSTDEKKIDELLSRGVDEALPTTESLKKLLMSGKQLRIKLGVDPTGTKLHIGHSVPLLKLKDFQDLGHKVVFIVGDFTAVIGDTSDKESERPMLTHEEIAKNMQSWKEQVGKVLDLSKTEFRKNSEWLGKLTYREIGEHADIFSVADFTARDNIKKRLDAGKRVSLREVLYPLMQGYDSVAVKADVELGGTDQRFNLLAGRSLQERFKQAPQHVLTFSLITDASGKKISKTGAATVYFTDDPTDMFGKIMSTPDELIEQYFVSMTRASLEQVNTLLSGHPKEAKMALAEELVRMYHGEAASKKARENFDNTFTKKGIPEEVTAVAMQGTILETFVEGKIVESKSEVRRLVTQGAVTHMDSGEKVADVDESPKEGVYKIGKHRFVKCVK